MTENTNPVINEAERNALVWEFARAVEDDDDDAAKAIATGLPPGEAWPFLVALTHTLLQLAKPVIGDAFNDDLRLQALEARMLADVREELERGDDAAAE